MSNRKMLLSEKGKEILDMMVDALEIERPMAVKVALAKGIAISNGPVNEEFPGGNKWTIPDALIKDKEYLLFKHLIISEIKSPLSEEELNKQMALFIEIGLRKLKDEFVNKNSIEDFRLSIL